jgi:hypothetical protein
MLIILIFGRDFLNLVQLFVQKNEQKTRINDEKGNFFTQVMNIFKHFRLLLPLSSIINLFHQTKFHVRKLKLSVE